MIGLVVGRFQPLHLGHLRMLEAAAGKCDLLIIGIGSANKAKEAENPFTDKERQRMIRLSLKTRTRFEFLEIPDFGNDDKWVDWIRHHARFDAVLTNSLNEKKIFEKAGYKVMELPFFDRGRYSATEVRRRIITGEGFADLLPEGTLKVMEEVGGRERIMKLKGGGV